MRLQRTLFIVPNLFTLSSLFCGFYSISLSIGNTSSRGFYQAALLIIFAIFFDLFDGRVARLTRTQSFFGLELDSLCDLVSFGIAPAVLIYGWSVYEKGILGLLCIFFYVAGSAIRLARFNILSKKEKTKHKRNSKYITGLPVPVCAGLLASLVTSSYVINITVLQNSLFLSITVLTLALLMVSRIKFRSFKDLHLSWRTTGVAIFAVVSSVAVAAKLRPAFILLWLCFCYILIGLGEEILKLAFRKKRKKGEKSYKNGLSP
jgi:CDP-diacylglycerol--serine O-phosphatidyltransferase